MRQFERFLHTVPTGKSMQEDDVSVLESLKTSGRLTLTSQSVVTIVSAHIVMSFVFQTLT